MASEADRLRQTLLSMTRNVDSSVAELRHLVANLLGQTPTPLPDWAKHEALHIVYLADDLERTTFWHAAKATPSHVDMYGDNFPKGSTSVNQLPHQQSRPPPSPSLGKRPLGRDATKAARKKSSSVALEFAANLQVLNMDKIDQWNKEFHRRASRDEQFLAMERAKFKEKLRLERERLALEKEKMELQRRAEEWEMTRVELQHRADEERILSIDLDKCSTDTLREYYKNLQDEIMEKILARRRHDM